MPSQFVILSGPDKGRTYPLIPGSPFIIGRGQPSHTKLVDPQVSRNHCEVSVDGGRTMVSDSGSVGGTFLNDQRITSQELRTGDVIRVGETVLRFENALAEETILPPPPVKEIVFAQKARGQAV